tara:strand:- start:260 stop:682 length:423 start_codon:yes stop_codon:yes gene_type:complete
MDIYDISFILSTLWVGPFWFAMLFNPSKEKTKKLLNGPWFFLGPIIIWYFIFFISPPDLSLGSSGDSDMLQALANSFATKSGLTATWAHLVAGDIFVTKWIWKKGLEKQTNIWILRFSIFFGVMLMPIGLGAFMIFGSKK